MDTTPNSFIEGAGLVLRAPHLNPLLSLSSHDFSTIQWVELLGDNFLCPDLPLLEKVDQVRQKVPIVIHLTGLSLASEEPLNEDYLKQVDRLIHRYRPSFISDHLCWSVVGNHHLHDLLPFPFTKNALNRIAEKIQQLQNRWQRDFLIENISSYLSCESSVQDFAEVDFINALIKKADCRLLLDINNVYVSARNHGYSPLTFLENVDVSAIRQIHLAGFSKQAHLLIDTHSKKIHEEVWQLFLDFIHKHGPFPTVLEWDHDLPELSILLEETKKIASALEGR
jgi:uncharacterized protein (UPF0276 family)